MRMCFQTAARIIDLWGVGLSHIGFARDFLAVAVRQTVILYPETLDRVLVVNAEARLVFERVS